MMWRTAFAVVCLSGLVLGCGEGEPKKKAPAPPTTPPSTAAAVRGPARIPAESAALELDVIVEAEPDEGPPPLTVKFQGYVEEEEGGPWKFAWDFGDGSSSAEQNPTHTYQKEGEYTATLSVTDQRTNTGTDEIDVFVEKDE